MIQVAVVVVDEVPCLPVGRVMQRQRRGLAGRRAGSGSRLAVRCLRESEWRRRPGSSALRRSGELADAASLLRRQCGHHRVRTGRPGCLLLQRWLGGGAAGASARRPAAKQRERIQMLVLIWSGRSRIRRRSTRRRKQRRRRQQRPKQQVCTNNRSSSSSDQAGKQAWQQRAASSTQSARGGGMARLVAQHYGFDATRRIGACCWPTLLS